MKKEPLWKILVDRNIFEDKKTATSWIMMGNVLVNGQRVDKAGDKVAQDAKIIVKGLEQKYVSRGGYKLEGALNDFQLDIAGKIAIDSGASTGGFTDCLLQHGALKVYSVDVGYGQLVGKLRSDSRVVNMERMNIGDVKAEELDPQPNIASVDLSYLSLKKAIPIFRRLLIDDGEMLCLVKPLFEIHDSTACRNGRIESAADFRTILQELVDYTTGIGLTTLGVTNSPITGNNGTREFFMHISIDPHATVPDDPGIQIEHAIEKVMEIG